MCLWRSLAGLERLQRENLTSSEAPKLSNKTNAQS